MKKLIIYLLIFFSTASHAENIYVGAGIGSSFNKIWDYSSFSSRDESDKAIKLLIGYQVNQIVSTELFFTDLGQGKFNHIDGSNGILDMSSLGLAVRFNLFKVKKVTQYVKIGANRLRNSETWSDSTSFDKKTDTNIYWAIGGEYALDKSYFLTADYDAYGHSGAFNRNDWANQPAGVKSNSLTIGIRRIF